MPYIRKFDERLDIPYLQAKKPAVVPAVEKAVAEGKPIYWESSSFTDPGNDWNNLVVDGKSVYYENGY